MAKDATIICKTRVSQQHVSSVTSSRSRVLLLLYIALGVLFTVMMLQGYILLSAALVPGIVARPSPRSTFTPLRFTANGTFQISIFEDLHYGEAEDLDWGPEQDIRSETVINTVLDNESPQLAVLNGDLITGENTYLHNSSHYVDEIVRPLVQRNLPWASTYGNHDSQYNLSREAIFAREHLYTNSLTGDMVQSNNSGVTNYYLPVYSSDVTNLTPELILWFFDSRGGYMYQELDGDGNTVPQDEWVDQSVVSWFLSTRSHLSTHYNKTIPSLAFYHIPTNAMLSSQQSSSGVSPILSPGINDDNPLAQQGLSSSSGEYIGADIPFMEALVSTPGLIATFSGHDHGDDWCMKWTSNLTVTNSSSGGVSDKRKRDITLPTTLNGTDIGDLNLCFGRHSGYGGYGTWMRGARQVLYTLPTQNTTSTSTSKWSNETTKPPATGGKFEVKTWNRLEDTTISGEVMLNSTYGISDVYPVVEEKYTSCC